MTKSNAFFVCLGRHKIYKFWYFSMRFILYFKHQARFKRIPEIFKLNIA